MIVLLSKMLAIVYFRVNPLAFLTQIFGDDFEGIGVGINLALRQRSDVLIEA